MWERERYEPDEDSSDGCSEYPEWNDLCVSINTALEGWWEQAPNAQQVKALAGEP